MALIADWKAQKINEPKDTSTVMIQNETERKKNPNTTAGGERRVKNRASWLWDKSKQFNL